MLDHFSDGFAFTDYLARIERAREITGVEQMQGPDPERLEAAQARAREMSVALVCERVVDDETGMVVWEIRVGTDRGTISYRREGGEDWEKLLARAGFGRRRDGR